MRAPESRRGAYWVLCLASAAGYIAAGALVRSDYSRGDFLIFLSIFGSLSLLWAIALALAGRSPPTRKLIFAAAVAFRLLLLPAGLDWETGAFRTQILYDDDVWRYLWEGHAWSAGVNPLQVAPEELEEYELELDNPALHEKLYGSPPWSDIFDNIGYRQFASPYPHVAQGVFRLAHALCPGSVLFFKLLIVAFDLGNLWLLSRLCRRLHSGVFPLVAYAWNPLVIKEFAGSAHLDAVLVFLLLAAVCAGRKTSGLWLAAAALVKPVPLALIPALYKRFGWAVLLLPAAALALIVVDTPEGMKAYAQYWLFNPALSRLLPDSRVLQLLLPAVAVGAVALIRYRKDEGSLEALTTHGLWVLGACLLTTPMLAPWYLTWILPFAAIRRAWFWLALSASAFLSYHAYLRFEENICIVALEYSIPVGVWLWLRRGHSASSSRRESAGVDPSAARGR